MRLTQISLTNFRSFRATQNIDLAPVTLLFGPNSVGKSSILLAMFYVQQILKHGHCDPLRIDALGNKHVGGFKSLVNGRDLTKRITIKLTYSKDDFIGSSYSKLPELLDDNLGLTVDSPTADANEVSVQLVIAWSKQMGTAYVANYTVWLDGTRVAELESTASKKQPMISYLNYDHPALKCDDDTDEFIESLANDYVSKFQEVINESRLTSSLLDAKDSLAKTLIHQPIGFKGFAGSLPNIGEKLETVLSLDDAWLSERVHEILSDALVAPLDNLLKLLDESLCIGPLRMVPDARYVKNPYPSQGDWYSGSASWDELGDYGMDIDGISHWLSAEETLNLGYSLRTKASKTFSTYPDLQNDLSGLKQLIDLYGDSLELSISDEKLSENPDALETNLDIQKIREILESQTSQAESKQAPLESISSEQVLWDEINKIEVSSSDIGVGVSQVLPLVVGSLRPNTYLIACEQPELHVHPRVQVGLGDLLLQCSKTKSFLIETHSEHLILRILRRIRETTEGDLPEGVPPAFPQDVSIVYLEPGPGGVTSRKIEISEDGDFVQRWPHGFFSERGKELF